MDDLHTSCVALNLNHEFQERLKNRYNRTCHDVRIDYRAIKMQGDSTAIGREIDYMVQSLRSGFHTKFEQLLARFAVDGLDAEAIQKPTELTRFETKMADPAAWLSIFQLLDVKEDGNEFIIECAMQHAKESRVIATIMPKMSVIWRKQYQSRGVYVPLLVPEAVGLKESAFWAFIRDLGLEFLLQSARHQKQKPLQVLQGVFNRAVSVSNASSSSVLADFVKKLNTAGQGIYAVAKWKKRSNTISQSVPRFDVPFDQLQNAIDAGFSWSDVIEILPIARQWIAYVEEKSRLK